MLSEISQVQKDNCMILHIWDFQNGQTHKNRVEWQLVGDKGGKIGEMFFKGTNLQLVDK